MSESVPTEGDSKMMPGQTGSIAVGNGPGETMLAALAVPEILVSRIKLSVLHPWGYPELDPEDEDYCGQAESDSNNFEPYPGSLYYHGEKHHPPAIRPKPKYKLLNTTVSDAEKVNQNIKKSWPTTHGNLPIPYDLLDVENDRLVYEGLPTISSPNVKVLSSRLKEAAKSDHSASDQKGQSSSFTSRISVSEFGSNNGSDSASDKSRSRISESDLESKNVGSSASDIDYDEDIYSHDEFDINGDDDPAWDDTLPTTPFTAIAPQTTSAFEDEHPSALVAYKPVKGCMFMDKLPLEIRLHVYDKCFPDRKIPLICLWMWPHSFKSFTGNLRHHGFVPNNGDGPIDVSVLTINPAIHAEAAALFYGTRTFRFTTIQLQMTNLNADIFSRLRKIEIEDPCTRCRSWPIEWTLIQLSSNPNVRKISVGHRAAKVLWRAIEEGDSLLAEDLYQRTPTQREFFCMPWLPYPQTKPIALLSLPNVGFVEFRVPRLGKDVARPSKGTPRRRKRASGFGAHRYNKNGGIDSSS